MICKEISLDINPTFSYDELLWKIELLRVCWSSLSSSDFFKCVIACMHSEKKRSAYSCAAERFLYAISSILLLFIGFYCREAEGRAILEGALEDFVACVDFAFSAMHV